VPDRRLVYECFLTSDRSTVGGLRDEGFEVVSFDNFDRLLENIVRRRPRVLIYGLGSQLTEDIGMLRLLRRAAPILPLVLLATEGSLATQRLIQGLRPVYYAVCPIEPEELLDAVRAALARKPPRAES